MNLRFAPLLATIAVVLLTTGCSTGSTIKRTFKDPALSPFSNILIAADAEAYENRANYERLLSTRLNAAGYRTTPLYKIGGGNQPVTREALIAAVKLGGFDAVLFTHPLISSTEITKNKGTIAVDSSRKSDSAINLFRYDYEETALPDYESLAASAVLLTALYSVESENKLWETRTTLESRDNVSLLIDDAIKLLIREIKRDKLFSTSSR